MKVQVDALSARVGGGLSYIVQQLEGLVRVRPAWEISVLAAPWNERALQSVTGVTIRLVHVRSLAERLAFEQGLLPLQAGRFDVLYCPGNFAPLVARIPCVVAEQNLNYFGHGRSMGSGSSIRMRLEILLARLSIKKADAVLVTSQSLATEMKHDGLWTRKCRIVLSGAPVPARNSERPQGLDGLKPFLLSLANDYPHKRLDDLVRAWSRLGRADPPALVLAGAISDRRIAYQRSLVPPELRSCLVHLGSIASRSQVRWLLENALALVISSCLEAFPLTPAEAGEMGCPLIMTDIPPHREVCGNRGNYYQVGNLDGLLTQLNKLLDNPPTREPWRWPVTWEHNAQELATLLETVRRLRS